MLFILVGLVGFFVGTSPRCNMILFGWTLLSGYVLVICLFVFFLRLLSGPGVACPTGVRSWLFCIISILKK